MGASVWKHGSSYRLRIRFKGYKDLAITFHDPIRAKRWAEEHLSSYMLNPDKYHIWLKKNRDSMRRNGIFHEMIKIEDSNE